MRRPSESPGVGRAKEMISARVRLLLVLVVVVSLAAVAGCGGELRVPTNTSAAVPEPGEPPDGQDGAVERRIERVVFDLVNDERRERGLDALGWDNQLARLAREWSRAMADGGHLEHQDLKRMLERSQGFTVVGENIFRATGPVPASTIHVGWMRSEGHRVNVLRPAFDRIGVGVVCSDNGEVWATQRFGRTAGAELTEPGRDVPPEQPIVADEGKGPACPGQGGPIEVEPQATSG